MSDDGTRDVINSLILENSHIRMLDNPDRITPSAMNNGIVHAKGDILMILGAHATYPTTYIRQCVETLLEWEADNVGGICKIEPGADSPIASALALAQKHPLGVGNSSYRVGIDSPKWVDTVPYGCFPKELFDRIGLFDIELVRNQDDEFNARIINKGGKILLDPSIEFHKRTRPTLSQTARMFYQYGYFKPLAAFKAGRVYTLRQLAPPAFVMSFVVLAIGSFFSSYSFIAFLMMTLLYLGATIGVAFVQCRDSGPRVAVWLPLSFAVMHFSYGFGALRGFWDFLVRRRRVADASTSR